MDWSGVDYCDVFIRLSFWRHPFTAEHPLLRHWCRDTFLQIWWRNKLILISDDLKVRTFSCTFQIFIVPPTWEYQTMSGFDWICKSTWHFWNPLNLRLYFAAGQGKGKRSVLLHIHFISQYTLIIRQLSTVGWNIWGHITANSI